MIYDLEVLSQLALNRTSPFKVFGKPIEWLPRYRRALFIGGAGFIGQQTIDALLDWAEIDHISVVDLSENGIAEVIRNVEARSTVELATCPVSMSSPEFSHFIYGQRPYDIVFIFAAMKHVRSELSDGGIVRLYQTNVIDVKRACDMVVKHSPGCRLFYCSTDKAADPSTVMGATKWWGENIVLSHPNATCARFANVAFSSGSLLEGFLHRIAKHQSLSAPRGIRRAMFTPKEAGQFCLAAATYPIPGVIVIPGPVPTIDFAEAGRRLLKHFQSELGIDITDPLVKTEKAEEIFQGEREIATVDEVNGFTYLQKIEGDITIYRGAPNLRSADSVLGALKMMVPGFKTRVESATASAPSPVATPPEQS